MVKLKLKCIIIIFLLSQFFQCPTTYCYDAEFTAKGGLKPNKDKNSGGGFGLWVRY